MQRPLSTFQQLNNDNNNQTATRTEAEKKFIYFIENCMKNTLCHLKMKTKPRDFSMEKRNGTRRESSIFHNNVLIMFPALDSILLCHFLFRCFWCCCCWCVCVPILLMHCFMHFNSLLSAHRLSFVFAPIHFAHSFFHRNKKIHSNFICASLFSKFPRKILTFPLFSSSPIFLLHSLFLSSSFHNNLDKKGKSFFITKTIFVTCTIHTTPRSRREKKKNLIKYWIYKFDLAGNEGSFSVLNNLTSQLEINCNGCCTAWWMWWISSSTSVAWHPRLLYPIPRTIHIILCIVYVLSQPCCYIIISDGSFVAT